MSDYDWQALVYKTAIDMGFDDFTAHRKSVEFSEKANDLFKCRFVNGEPLLPESQIKTFCKMLGETLNINELRIARIVKTLKAKC